MSKRPVETTTYSLSSLPPTDDRRGGDERHMTLFRVGCLVVGDTRELCLIKNISAGGMMVRSYGVIAEGTCLSIELKCGQPISGRVSWSNGNDLGITFDTRIDVLDLLNTALDARRPRMPRIEVGGYATVRDGATVLRVRLADISQGGVKIVHEARIAPDSDVVVTVPGMPSQAGVLRWSDGECSGITFNAVLPLPQLMNWLIGQRDQEFARAS